MLEEPTVLILGAGASEPFGFPLGGELSGMISQACLSYVRQEHEVGALPPLQGFISNFSTERPAAHNAIRTIARGLTSGRIIDEFIYKHFDDTNLSFLSKILICYFIIEKERTSNFYVVHPNAPDSTFRKDEENWYGVFWDILTNGLTKSNIVQDIAKNISIVNFNYDRSIEQYMIFKMHFEYGIALSECCKSISNIGIIRPYGSPGHTVKISGDQLSFNYGTSMCYKDLISASNNIRVYTESLKENTMIQIKQNIMKSKNIIFLGFGFHSQNVDILNCSNMIEPPKSGHVNIGDRKNCYLTRMNISDKNLDVIKSRIRKSYPYYLSNAYGDNIYDEASKCIDFIKNIKLLIQK